MKAFLFIIRNLGPFRAKFALFCLVCFVDGAVNFLIPATLAELTQVSLGTTTIPFDRARLALITVSALYLFSLFLQFTIRRYGETVGRNFGNYLRAMHFRLLSELPISKLQERHSGYVLSLVNRISDEMWMLFVQLYWTFAAGSATLLLFLFCTARESLGLSALNFAVFVIFVALSTLLSKRMVPLYERLNRSQASLSERLADLLANVLTIKKLSLQSFANTRLASEIDRTRLDVAAIHRFQSTRWFVLHILFGSAYLSTLGWLLFQISAGHIGVTMLVLFVAAYSRVRSLIEQFSEVLVGLMTLQGYIDGLYSILGDEHPKTHEHTTKSWNSLEIRDGYFEYPTSKRSVTIPSFTVHRTEIVGVTGRSGLGKSTLLNLLGGLITPTKGEFVVREESGKIHPVSTITEQSAYISQETELFNLSLRENLLLGKQIDDATLYAELERIGMRSWAESLPDKLATLAGEKGVVLSAGQKQRLNLLRSILLNRDLLFLDEPTSHLDDATEELVVNYLAEKLKGKTAVIVTHRPRLLRLCTKLYRVTEEGRVEGA